MNSFDLKLIKIKYFSYFFLSKIILKLSLFIINLYLLNINKISRAKDFIGLIINLAFFSLIYFNFINILFLKINILFIYIIIIPNKLFLFQVINKYKSNINISIESLFL